jgi:predicted permease
MTAMAMLGGAAIGTRLHKVGAGHATHETFRPNAAVATGTALKLAGTPLAVYGWSLITGVAGTAFVACMVCAAVPTALSAYVLARQMGGDAPLVAAIVMMQTVVSFLSIPLVIQLAQRLQ